MNRRSLLLLFCGAALFFLLIGIFAAFPQLPLHRLAQIEPGTVLVASLQMKSSPLPKSEPTLSERTTVYRTYQRAFDSPLEPTATPTPLPSSERETALRYLSEQYGIPRNDLLIVDEETMTYPLLERTFHIFTIWAQPPSEFREFNLLVDVTDLRIEDIHAIRAQEEAAYVAKYGKLQPELYERLQKARNDEPILVAIWVTPDAAQRSQEELYQILVDKYPGAATSMTLYGVPWRVEDTALAEQIRNEYFQMLFDDNRVRVQPLVDALQASGALTVTTFDGLPSVTANLTKGLIYTIEQRDDVGTIYLIEDEIAPSCEMFTQLEQGAGHQPPTTLVRERAHSVEQKWSGMAPTLVVLATAADLAQVKPYLTQQAYEDLTKLDFTAHFAMIVLSEEDVSGGYVFCATSWLRTGNQLTVFVHSIQQPFMANMVVSYYDIFEVTKGENWHGNFTVQLQYTQHKLYVDAYDHETNGVKAKGIVAETMVTFP